jgi:hypothetical protein
MPRQEDPRERNARMNRFAREGEAKTIGSPFRVTEYCNARLKGKSPEEALRIAQSKGHGHSVTDKGG